MKTILRFALFCLLLLSLLVPTALAVDMTAPVGDVEIAYGTPTVDGQMDASEWLYKTVLSDENMKGVWQAGFVSVPEDANIDLYFMWDADNLYVCFDVYDTSPCYYTEWAWNGGDNIQFFLDLGPSLIDQTLKDQETLQGRYGPMFAVAPQVTDANNTPGAMLYTHQYVTSSAEDDILSLNGFPCGFSLTNDGWIAEIAIPWTMLREDMIAKVDTDVPIEAGTELNALLVYWDYNTSRAVHQYYGTTKTGYSTQFGWHPEEFGIHMTLLKKEEVTENQDQTPADPDTPAPDTADLLVSAVMLTAVMAVGTIAVSFGKKKDI